MSPTLFIDLDGTIMRNPFWTAVFPIISGRLAAATGLPAQDVLRMIMEENQRRMSSGKDVALAMDWDDIVHSVAARLGAPWQLSVEQLVIDNCKPPHIEMLDQADRALEAALRRGWRLVVASHGLSKYQLPVLKSLGLYSLFTDFATPDTRLCLKPDRCFWLPYVESKGPAVHVGDLYLDDVLAPKTCGVLAVWKPAPPAASASEADPFRRAALMSLPPGSAVRPDAVISRFSELQGVLERIVRPYSIAPRTKPPE
jgi:putative hydrolase of the HAD superfamily